MSRGDIPDPAGAALEALVGHEPMTIATIWATVDTERALMTTGMGADIGSPLADPLLGATVRLVRPADGGPWAALAEPTTEGRLAASLARHGEGPAGCYVEAPRGLADVARRASNAAIQLSPPSDGPFGRSVLVLIGPASGPFLILVERPAVPSRP